MPFKFGRVRQVTRLFKRNKCTLKTSAIAPDGVIEAIESSVFPFAVGLQWHPECMYRRHAPMKNLFLHFIKVSKKERHII